MERVVIILFISLSKVRLSLCRFLQSNAYPHFLKFLFRTLWESYERLLTDAMWYFVTGRRMDGVTEVAST